MAVGLIAPEPVWAQISPDRSLPRPSQVRRSGNRTEVTAGTQRGRNLFHSLRRFSIDSGETAAFQDIDASVDRVFVRVTGREASRINGRLEVLGANQQVSGADFFLLNPQGIFLGRNAVLRLGGSWIATTATRVNFADGSFFSAVLPESRSPLTVSVPRGLQFGQRPAPIQVRSTNLQVGSMGSAGSTDLRPRSAHTFALIGGDVTFSRSTLETNGNRLEIGSVAESGQVELMPIDDGWRMGYGNLQQLGDIRFNGAFLLTSGDRGGEIRLQAGQVELEALSTVASETQTQPGGDLTVQATQLIRVADDSSLVTFTNSDRPAGDVLIRTDQLVIQGGGQIGSYTDAGRGRGGDVQVSARSIRLSGISSDLGDPLSLLYTRSFVQGDAGDMRIQTERLQVLPGGQVSTTTDGSGNAGNMQIQANHIDLIGLVLRNGRPLLSENLPVSGGLFVGTDLDSTGNGGRLTIATDRLTIGDGAILQATTYGAGDAGRIEIEANEGIRVQGRSAQGGIPARIAATSGGIREFSNRRSRQATGRGGDLVINTPALTVDSGGVIAVNSLNPDGEGAGTMRIQADRIWLDHQGSLNAQTESGNRAEIDLQNVNLLFLRRNSKISTSAGLLQGGGDGGNIRIDADLLLAAPAENSDIDADAGEGNGGGIDVTAQGIIGITNRNQRTPNSDITATSDFGVAGEISLSTPAIDPTRGIVELPSTPVDAAQLIAQGCRAQTQTAAANLGEFVVTGRGGLPLTPADLRSSATLFTDWAMLPAESSAAARELSALPASPTLITPTLPHSPSPPSPPTSPDPLPDPTTARPIVEAQGWVQDPQGQVKLVAQAAHPTLSSPAWVLPGCGG